MTLRPCSDSEHGLFISVDGPSGAGKSTIVRHLAQMLVAAGKDVHVTAEPSNGPIGKLCRDLTDTVTGYTLACLYAADRYHHVETEIRQHCDAGKVVISDRYLASGLVMQPLTALTWAIYGSSTPEPISPTWPSFSRPILRSSRNAWPSAGRTTASSSRPAAASPKCSSTGRRPIA